MPKELDLRGQVFQAGAVEPGHDEPPMVVALLKPHRGLVVTGGDGGVRGFGDLKLLCGVVDDD